jgi:hypoxanthine-DNA glycosylase
VFFVAADFAVICVPHRNYAAGVVSWSPYKHNKSVIQITDRYETVFANVTTKKHLVKFLVTTFIAWRGPEANQPVRRHRAPLVRLESSDEEMGMRNEFTEGLPLVVGASPKILVLGTFPGEESLKQKQYYAHPRNLFWEFMEQICGAGRDIDYEERLNILRNNHIALWDVLRTCSRQVSLDTNIRNGYYEVNDFKEFLVEHQINAIYFNGQKAGKLFRKFAAATLTELPALLVLPSTSPANAGISKDAKINQWLVIKEHLE